MVKLSLSPCDYTRLSEGTVIFNSHTGEKLEILEADGLILKMKSLLDNSIILKLINQIVPDQWWILSTE